MASKVYTINIDGNAVPALNLIKKEATALEKEIRGLTPGTEIFTQKVDQLGQKKAQIAQVSTEIKSLAQAAATSAAATGGAAKATEANTAATEKGGTSMAALRKQYREQDQVLGTLIEGTAEYAEQLKKMADTRDAMGDLKGAIAALNPDAKLQGFLQLGEVATAAFSIATVAAENFGLSGGSLEKYQAKLLGLISVIQSIETFRAALEPEKFAGIKAIYASITGGLASVRAGFSLTAIQARISSITIRQALLATGVGALVVAIGLLIANFDTVKEYGAKIYERFKPFFDKMLAAFSAIGDGVRTAFHYLTFGLVDDVETAARAVANAEAKIARARAARLADNEKTYADAIDKGLAIDQRAAVARAKIAGDSEVQLARIALQGAKDRVEALRGVRAADDELRARLLEARAAVADAERALTKVLEDEAKKRQEAREKAEKESFDKFKKSTDGLERIPVTVELRPDLEKFGKLPTELPTLVLPVKVDERALADENFQKITENIQRASQTASSIVQSLASEATTLVDAQLEALGDRLSSLDERLSTSRSQIEKDEQALETASGARRSFLIGKIEQEKKAEAGLRKERAAAAAEQKAAEERKQKLQDRTTKANQIAVAVETILATVSMIRTAANSGQFAGPAAPFVIAATAAAGVAAALALKSALKFEAGGMLPGGVVQGPSHANGGVKGTGRFANVEVEGGEFIVNKTSTARFLPVLQQLNEIGRTRYVPASDVHFASGGQLPSPSPVRPTSGAPGESASAPLAAAELLGGLLAIRAQLERVEHAVMIAPTLAPKPVLRIGTVEAEAISEQQAQAAQQKALATF